MAEDDVEKGVDGTTASALYFTCCCPCGCISLSFGELRHDRTLMFVLMFLYSVVCYPLHLLCCPCIAFVLSCVYSGNGPKLATIPTSGH